MGTISTLLKKTDTIDTFKIKGEEFVVLKKEYLDELVILMKSFLEGEELLKKRQTRSFSEFLESIKRRR